MIIITPRWRNKGAHVTVLWQVITTSGYAQKITQASLIAPLPWGRTKILAEPFLSPEHRTGWIRADKGKGIRWQDTSNSKSWGEVATQS